MGEREVIMVRILLVRKFKIFNMVIEIYGWLLNVIVY